MSFDGDTFDPKLDGKRLSTQLWKVFTALYGGDWLSLIEIANKAGLSMAQLPGITARIRDLRKIRFGSHTVERRRVKETGVWEYKLTVRQPRAEPEQLPLDLGKRRSA